ncbi:transmembrane protein, putative [Medicago truncatula]|uniref:Transmembrane protein, putative n=1 Tax=Medicago truncatula TaxID=3880 RepID=A0A072VGJ3_MEDTR|nr:transmembrane protein, putative [Medicago truncatula]
MDEHEWICSLSFGFDLFFSRFRFSFTFRSDVGFVHLLLFYSIRFPKMNKRLQLCFLDGLWMNRFERIVIDALCEEGLLQRNVDMVDRINRKRNSHSPLVVVNSSLILRILEKEE